MDGEDYDNEDGMDIEGEEDDESDNEPMEQDDASASTHGTGTHGVIKSSAGGRGNLLASTGSPRKVYPASDVNASTLDALNRNMAETGIRC